MSTSESFFFIRTIKNQREPVIISNNGSPTCSTQNHHQHTLSSRWFHLSLLLEIQDNWFSLSSVRILSLISVLIVTTPGQVVEMISIYISNVIHIIHSNIYTNSFTFNTDYIFYFEKKKKKKKDSNCLSEKLRGIISYDWNYIS